MSRLSFRIVLTCLAGFFMSWGLRAEVVYNETFDGPGLRSGISIMDSKLGWDSVGDSGGVTIADGKSSFRSNYLDASSAWGGIGSIFTRKVPSMTQGVVKFSCAAVSRRTSSFGSAIGVISHTFSDRRAQWTCAEGGWMFWVGRVDSKGLPYTDAVLGPKVTDQEKIDCVENIPVKLAIFVDLDRYKTWGQIESTDAKGVSQIKKTSEYDWDPMMGDVSGIFICIDRRENRDGFDVDDISVQGVRHVAHPNPFSASAHTIYQMNGSAAPISSPAEIRWISEKWTDGNAQMPDIVWMPEKKRLLMLVECSKRGEVVKSAFIFSDDMGKTWSNRAWLRPKMAKDNANALGMMYLGEGKLIAPGLNVEGGIHWISEDYGETWKRTEPSPLSGVLNLWHPPARYDAGDGNPNHLIEQGWEGTGVEWGSDAGPYSEGFLRFSEDNGLTWGREIKIPEWISISEGTIIQAANGDLVAALRTDLPKRYQKTQNDHYAGLATSRSSDLGKTWSKPELLYAWGRHHPSMILLKNGDILMTYVVRMGYTPDEKGYFQFGVEAILSKDNGQTWDLDHRIILANWKGDVKGEFAWYSGVQSTSTVMLADETILTAFGTGFRNPPDAEVCIMDVALVRWRLPDNKLNDERTLRDASFDSETRNILTPPSAK